jgi:predicted glycosyltransferase
VTGHGIDASLFRVLSREAEEGVTIERHHDDLGPFLRAAMVSISQAGYNTVVEALVAGAPMVLVPFAQGGEDEQSVRAARLAALGAASVLSEHALRADLLAAAIDNAAARGTPRLPIDTAGAGRSAEVIAGLLVGS